jgi:hypothetical protein
MQLALYTAIKSRLESIASLKYVALWNNQFEREDINVSFNYPCAFIDFSDINYEDRLNGKQNCTMTVNIHIGFESYKTEDTDILTLKQTVNAVLHGKSLANQTRMLRRGETQNFDHTNVQEYIISYNVTGNDISAMNLPTETATIDTLDITIDPIITNYSIRTGVEETEVILATETDTELITESGYELVIQE